MPVNDIDGWKAFQVLSGITTAVLGWVGVRFVKDIDELKQNYVSRGELREMLNEMREDRRSMHLDILSSIDDLRATGDRLSERVDNLIDRG